MAEPYDYRFIVNPRTAELLENLGLARDRDFLVSEPLPADMDAPADHD